MSRLQKSLKPEELFRVAKFAYPPLQATTSKPGQQNLYDMIGRFPGRGVGFKVFRKSWPEESYWHIKFADKLSPCGKKFRVYGVKYWKGQLVSDSISRINGANKRGIWQFDMNGKISLSDHQINLYNKMLEEKKEQESQEGAEQAEPEEQK